MRHLLPSRVKQGCAVRDSSPQSNRSGVDVWSAHFGLSRSPFTKTIPASFKTIEVQNAVGELAEEVADSLNFYVEAQEETARRSGIIFDSKTVFKSKVRVHQVEREVVAHIRYQARRNPDYGFQVDPSSH